MVGFKLLGWTINLIYLSSANQEVPDDVVQQYNIAIISTITFHYQVWLLFREDLHHMTLKAASGVVFLISSMFTKHAFKLEL